MHWAESLLHSGIRRDRNRNDIQKLKRIFQFRNGMVLLSHLNDSYDKSSIPNVPISTFFHFDPVDQVNMACVDSPLLMVPVIVPSFRTYLPVFHTTFALLSPHEHT